MSTKLVPGVPAPDFTVPLLGGGTFDLAARKPEALTMVVVYRGYHCPICKEYLGKLDGMVAGFAEAGAEVVALSMDSEERAGLARDEWGLANLTVGYGMSEETARKWGLYISSAFKEGEAAVFAEPGTFWVLPNGILYLIDIANMPFARPDLELLLSRVKAPGNGYPARGVHTG